MDSKPSSDSDSPIKSSPPRGKNRRPRKKNFFWRWTKRLFWIFVLAVLFRAIVLEAFTIPSDSMAGTLRQGDFMLVSKLHYGPRSPSTLLHVPLSHRKIWGTDWNSYLDVPALRLPIFRISTWAVKRNDVIVFNNPLDSLPVELKTPYVKRCIALPGDRLQIQGGKIYADSLLIRRPNTRQFRYYLRANKNINLDFFKKNGIEEVRKLGTKSQKIFYEVRSSPEKIKVVDQLIHVGIVEKLSLWEQSAGQKGEAVFPEDPDFKWNVDHYGPLVVPAKGLQLPMSSFNLHLYFDLIRRFESDSEDQVEIREGRLFINQKEILNYTFKQNYYFVLGDNFHHSLDSRHWGFVPENHIIGKAWMIFWSLDPERSWGAGKVRFDRLGWIR